MRISRLYVSNQLAAETHIPLDQEAAHYVRTVLRLRVGDSLILFNGCGGEYAAKVEIITRKEVLIAVGNWTSCERESPLQINLALGISRGERMSFAIQKAVELGVSQIYPLTMERSVVKLTGEKATARQQHWQKIAQNASEQCGRDCLVKVTEALDLKSWIQEVPVGTGIILDPKGNQALNQIELNTAQPVNLCIGPEGGLTEDEQTILSSNGFIGIRLGPRVLRTETAVLAALTALQVCWGDLR